MSLMLWLLYARSYSRLSSLHRGALWCDFSPSAFPRKTFTAIESLVQPNESHLEEDSHQNVSERVQSRN